MKISKETLEANGEKIRHSEIKVHENGKQVIILNPGRDEFLKIHMDGGVIKNATCCDFLLSRIGFAELLIELKGVDVGHAVKQICVTADLLDAAGIRIGLLAGLVVCARRPNPRFSTSIQRQQNAFFMKYKCFIHIVDKNKSFNFARFFEGEAVK